MSQINDFGDYGFRPIVSAFRPDISTIATSEPMFGMPLQIQYLYGFLQTEDGRMFSPERKFNGSLTGGLYFMAFDGSTLEMHPGTGGGARGELRRTITPEHRRWEKPIFYSMPEGVARPGELDFVLDLQEDRIVYQEGDLFEVTGTLTGLGLQHYTPMRHEGLFYTSVAYWVSGTVLGEKAEGVLFFDNAYWQHSIEWKEYSFYQGEQVGWQVIGNQFEDGTLQWGIIVQGATGFCPAVLIEGDKVIAQSGEASTYFDVDDKGFITKALSTVGDTQWEYTAEEKGYMESFSNTRWNNYLAQLGQTRQVGDERVLRRGYTWMEHFPDRIREIGRDKQLG